MNKIYCNNCKKVMKEKNMLDIRYHKYGKDMYWHRYILCKDCFDAMKREIPKLLNWRNRLK